MKARSSLSDILVNMSRSHVGMSSVPVESACNQVWIGSSHIWATVSRSRSSTSDASKFELFPDVCSLLLGCGFFDGVEPVGTVGFPR